MTRFIVSLYNFFQAHKTAFYLSLIISFATFIFFGTKIRYEEDITKLLPSAEDSDGSEKLAFADLKVKDKIFLLFSADENAKEKIGTDKLAEICDSFVVSLTKKDSVYALTHQKKTINEVLYRLDIETMMGAVQFLQNNTPIFIEKKDYKSIDSIISPENIEKQLTENNNLLFSPAGMAYQEMIMQDPLAFRNLFKNKMSSIQKGLGGNFTVINNHFFAPDSSFALAFIAPNFKSFDSKASNELIEMIETEIPSFLERQGYTNGEIKIHYHGTPVQSVYNARQIKKDLMMTLIASLAIISIVIGICFKNKSTLIYLILPIVYGSFFALTILYLIKGSISLLAMGIGAIVLGVALSYCLHVITHYKYVSNPIKVLEDQTLPVILGCLTTIGAFSSLMFTKAELLKDFGLFASLALAGTTFFCLVFLPHFFNPEKNKRSEKAFSILERINSFPFEKNTKLIFGIFIVCAICLFTKNRVTFDSDLVNIGYHAPHVVESQNMLASKTAEGYNTVYYATSAQNLDSALAYNKVMLNVLDSLLSIKKIKSYSKATTLFISKDEQKERIEDWNKFWSGGKIDSVKSNMLNAYKKLGYEAEAAEAMSNFLIENLEKKYEPVSIYESGVIPSALMSNIIEESDNNYMIFTPVQLKKEEKREISDIVTSHKHCIVIDPFYYTNDMVELINDDFNVTLFISSLFVFIVLLISFKSIILAALSFIPMSLSWYIVLGVMGIFNLQFNLINIVISTFIFGMGVDYSIFIMDGLLENFRTKTKLLVFHKTAILFSAFVLIVGISSLMFATHPAISSIGISTLIGMSAAVLISYSIQPFLFYWLIKRPTLRGKAPITLYNLINAESYFKKGRMTDTQKMRNNYEYKGFDIEQSIRKELKDTSSYAEIENVLPAQGDILDYGCGYGFTSYLCRLKDDKNKVVCFDKNEAEIMLAQNCYLKNQRMYFTSSSSVLEKVYDTVFINKDIDEETEMINNIITNARIIIVRKTAEKAEDFCKTKKLTTVAEDKLFIIYRNLSHAEI